MQLETKKAIIPKYVREWDDIVQEWKKNGSKEEDMSRHLQGVILVAQKNIEGYTKREIEKA